jgi:hypothetical protein
MGKIETVKNEVPAYISWDYKTPQARDKALAKMAEAVDGYQAIQTSKADHSRTRNFEGLTTNVDGRPGLTWSDYDYFRFSESVPTKFPDILTACNNAYRQVGLIRNVIDLMGDFACQGIRLVHPNRRVEKFFESWWHRVQGKNVSERFLNYLFRLGNDVIRMKTATIVSSEREKMQRSIASPDMEVNNSFDFNKGEIPWQYNFLDPRSVDVVGGALGNFIGTPQYFFTVPKSLNAFVQKNKGTAEFKELMAQLPEEVRKAMETNSAVKLPSEKTFVYHYRRDDWETWATPIIYACLDDVNTLNKLKLADRAALDGAISKIRVWKLGSLEHKLAPNQAASETLASILGNHVGGGTIDVIWGPDLELVETDTNVHQFLGEEKYKPTFINIYACLGIPPTLTGTFGAAGTTNNFISLKTLTERLKYARGILMGFWKSQIQIVQRTMGFRFPAQVEFDFMNLDDQGTINQLLINLSDRSIISDEFVQRHIGAITDIEKLRIKREGQDREKGRMPPKASPYHEPEQEFGLKKIFAQTGTVTPSEVGLELEPKKKGEKPALTMKVPSGGGNGKSPSGGTPGRPKGVPDSGPRKQKKFTPKLRAQLELWARDTQKTIASYANRGFLTYFNKKNMRSLTKEEFNYAEQIKFELLCGMEPFSEITHETFPILTKNKIDASIHEEFNTWLDNNDLTIEEVRNIRASFYVNYVEESQQND